MISDAMVPGPGNRGQSSSINNNLRASLIHEDDNSDVESIISTRSNLTIPDRVEDDRLAEGAAGVCQFLRQVFSSTPNESVFNPFEQVQREMHKMTRRRLALEFIGGCMITVILAFMSKDDSS
jgi:hypothetical protein